MAFGVDEDYDLYSKSNQIKCYKKALVETGSIDR